MTSEETQISEELKGCYENLIVIDIGANLTNKKYGRDLDSVVQRAKDAGMFPTSFQRQKEKQIVPSEISRNVTSQCITYVCMSANYTFVFEIATTNSARIEFLLLGFVMYVSLIYVLLEFQLLVLKYRFHLSAV